MKEDKNFITNTIKHVHSLQSFYRNQNNSVAPIPPDTTHEKESNSDRMSRKITGTTAFLLSEPHSFSSCSEDVLLYIFSYVNGSDILAVSQTSSLWRNVSMADDLWKSYYEELLTQQLYPAEKPETDEVTSDYRYWCLQIRRNAGDLQNCKLSEQKYRKLASIIAYFPTIALLLFLIGIIVYTIVFVLFLDDVLLNIPKNHAYMLLPFILLFTGPFIVLLILYLILKNVILRTQYWYAEKVSKIMHSMKFVDGIVSANVRSDNTLALLSIFAVVPILGTCIYIRLVFNLTMIPWRAVFSPFYLYSVLYLTIPGIHYTFYYCNSYIRKLSAVPYPKWIYTYPSFYIWTTGCIIQILLSIQLGLISGKLDNTIGNARYIQILTPTWVLFGIICFVCPFCCTSAGILYVCGNCFSDNEGGESRETITPGLAYCGCIGWIASCFMYPVAIWLILFIVRLDNFAKYMYVYAWIPAFMCIACVLCVFCCCGTLVCGRAYFRWFTEQNLE
jgi:hypothetical protein